MQTHESVKVANEDGIKKGKKQLQFQRPEFAGVILTKLLKSSTALVYVSCFTGIRTINIGKINTIPCVWTASRSVSGEQVDDWPHS